MSLQTGRKAIATYIEAQWANGIPMGMPGHPFTQDREKEREKEKEKESDNASQERVGEAHTSSPTEGVLLLLMFLLYTTSPAFYPLLASLFIPFYSIFIYSLSSTSSAFSFIQSLC